MAHPRFRRARAHKMLRRTAGDYTTLNATVRTAVDGTNWDIVLPASVGDTIEAGVQGLWGNQAQGGILDIGAVVSGSVAHWLSGQSGAIPFGGIPGSFAATSTLTAISAMALYPLVAADISSGKVTLRLFYVLDFSSNKTLYANDQYPMFMYAKNLGPVAPH